MPEDDRARALAVAVVDIGKTTAKLALVDPASGATLDARTRPNRVAAGPPYPHADVEGLWAFVVEGLAAVAGGRDLAGIAVTTHGATAALMAGRRAGAAGSRLRARRAGGGRGRLRRGAAALRRDAVAAAARRA